VGPWVGVVGSLGGGGGGHHSSSNHLTAECAAPCFGWRDATAGTRRTQFRTQCLLQSSAAMKLKHHRFSNISILVPYLVGMAEGVTVGRPLGSREGVVEGETVGKRVGRPEGILVGTRVGRRVGFRVGRDLS
jgi:hypothetical protein